MRRSLVLSVCLLLVFSVAASAQTERTLDLRRAVPSDVYLLVHGTHNPERDYQQEYYARVWQTVTETGIIEKITQIVSANVPKQELEQVQSVMGELRTAAEPIDLHALSQAEELIYAQRMRGVTNQQMMILRLGPAAEDTATGIENLMQLAEKYSGGAVPVQSFEHEGVSVTQLVLPSEARFMPMVAHLDGILFLANSGELLKQAITMLLGGEEPSKFDDPRLQAALKQLPEPEDAMVFYDGKMQFEQMKKIGDFIRREAGGNPGANRVAGLMEAVFDEVAIVDFELTVETTEGYQNRTEAYGRLLPDVEDKMLYKAIASGQQFEDWQSWVPADAISFSLQTGLNLHPVYERVLELAEEHFPESKAGLERFDAFQEELGINIDRDLLQAFSGESVSITLPAAQASLMGNPDTVIGLRCLEPDGIRELIQRAVAALQEHPVARAQQLQIVGSDQLEGFDRISAVLLDAFGISPTFGFVDGWLILGSNASAIERVLQVRAGSASTVMSTERVAQLVPDFEGPVAAISYTNLGQSIRTAGKAIGQAGAVANLIMGMTGMQAGSEKMKPVRDILGLLPDVGRIVAEFDFLDHQLTVTQAVADDPGAYRRKSVIQIQRLEDSGSTDATK